MFLLTFMFIGLSLPQMMAQTTVNANTSASKVVKFKITGMTCGGCANHVSKALQKIDGVISEEVEYPGDIAIVTFTPTKVKEKQIIAAIKKVGYKAEIINETKSKK